MSQQAINIDSSKQRLEAFFQQFLLSFAEKDTTQFSELYHLPCTLYSPDDIVLLNSKEQFDRKFGQIFQQLTEVNLSAIKLLNGCFQITSQNLYLVNIGWQLFDDSEQLISEFCAIYHIADIEQELQIINVMSQELSAMLTLPHSLSLK